MSRESGIELDLADKKIARLKTRLEHAEQWAHVAGVRLGRAIIKLATGLDGRIAVADLQRITDDLQIAAPFDTRLEFYNALIEAATREAFGPERDGERN